MEPTPNNSIEELDNELNVFIPNETVEKERQQVLTLAKALAERAGQFPGILSTLLPNSVSAIFAGQISLAEFDEILEIAQSARLNHLTQLGSGEVKNLGDLPIHDAGAGLLSIAGYNQLTPTPKERNLNFRLNTQENQ